MRKKTTPLYLQMNTGQSNKATDREENASLLYQVNSHKSTIFLLQVVQEHSLTLGHCDGYWIALVSFFHLNRLAPNQSPDENDCHIMKYPIAYKYIIECNFYFIVHKLLCPCDPILS